MKTIVYGLLVSVPVMLLLFGASPAAPEPVPGNARLERAVFAGGCFWCMEHPFDQLPGVVSVTPGYTGGHAGNPTYEQVSSGGTGHTEAVEIVYDPSEIAYKRLLDVFWRNIDPTDAGGQFCDRGTQYRSGIFYRGEEQRKGAEESLRELEKNKPFQGKIVTQIVAGSEFWPAEEYHRQYYKKNPIRYRYYRSGCGRDARLKTLWGAK